MAKILKVRLPKKIIKEIDLVTKQGFFVNRNELIREAVRRRVEELKRGKRK